MSETILPQMIHVYLRDVRPGQTVFAAADALVVTPSTRAYVDPTKVGYLTRTIALHDLSLTLTLDGTWHVQVLSSTFTGWRVGRSETQGYMPVARIVWPDPSHPEISPAQTDTEGLAASIPAHLVHTTLADVQPGQTAFARGCAIDVASDGHAVVRLNASADLGRRSDHELALTRAEGGWCLEILNPTLTWRVYPQPLDEPTEPVLLVAGPTARVPLLIRDHVTSFADRHPNLPVLFALGLVAIVFAAIIARSLVPAPPLTPEQLAVEYQVATLARQLDHQADATGSGPSSAASESNIPTRPNCDCSQGR